MPDRLALIWSDDGRARTGDGYSARTETGFLSLRVLLVITTPTGHQERISGTSFAEARNAAQQLVGRLRSNCAASPRQRADGTSLFEADRRA